VAVKNRGKAVGTLTVDQKPAREYLAAGALLVALGTDTSLLTKAAKDLSAVFKGTAVSSPSTGGAMY
jgi:4-hydroxy-2-oxoheptanedioate aldolase